MENLTSIVIYLFGVSIVSICYVQGRVPPIINSQQAVFLWHNIWVKLFYITSWSFLIICGILALDNSTDLTREACTTGAILCLIFYVLNKLLEHIMHIEKIRITRKIDTIPRIESNIYRTYILLALLPLFALFVSILITSKPSLAPYMECTNVTIPALIWLFFGYNLLLEVSLAAMFIWPLANGALVLKDRTFSKAFRAQILSTILSLIATALNMGYIGMLLLSQRSQRSQIFTLGSTTEIILHVIAVAWSNRYMRELIPQNIPRALPQPMQSFLPDFPPSYYQINRTSPYPNWSPVPYQLDPFQPPRAALKTSFVPETEKAKIKAPPLVISPRQPRGSYFDFMSSLISRHVLTLLNWYPGAVPGTDVILILHIATTPLLSIPMLKRAAASLLSPKKSKKAKNGDQKTIRSFFTSSSSTFERDGPNTRDQTTIIDLCSSDECEDKKRPSPSPKSVKRKTVNTVPNLQLTGPLHDIAPRDVKSEPSTVRPIDPNANPLLSTPNLSVDPLEFPLYPCPWNTNFPAPYAFLTHALVTLSSTRSRIAITNTLVNTFRLLIRYDARRSLLPALYLLSNSLAPSYEGVELNIGPSVVSKAIQSVSGISSGALRTMSQKLGDPGDVAFTAKSSLRTLLPVPPLQLASVHTSLLKISALKGQASAKQKQSIVEQLLVAARGEEVRYLVRMLSLNLRVGAVRTTIITALGRALVLTPPIGEEPKGMGDLRVVGEPRGKRKGKAKDKDKDDALGQKMLDAEKLVKRVYVRHPHFGHIVDAALESGLEGLSNNVQLTVGTPLHPTLGSPTRSLDEIYEQLGNLAFTAEFKYDGQRVQVHASRDAEKVTVRLFSRHLEDMTQKYPDIVHMAQTLMSQSEGTLDSFILDAEVVAVDPHTGAIRTFQELSNRPRKGVSLEDVKVIVCVYAFDLMYLNGEVLLDKPFRERRRLLHEWFPPLVPEDPFCSRLAHTESVESEDGREVVEEFWERAIASQCEGLMIKLELLDSGEVLEVVQTDGQRKAKRRRKPIPATYEPDKRTSAWLKLKKDYVEGLGDSLDLVPIGGWHGIGRKAGWWSPILLGLWDQKAGEFVGVCKCMSGFSDAFYKALNERYSEEAGTCSKTPYADVSSNGLVPPVWFKPSEVWEIKGADITLSPISQASKGLVAGDRGLSLRFPRFLRVREDKALSDATTPEFLAGLWRKQEGKGGGVDEGDLVDASSEEEPRETDESE
ncbi:unnamed protein product [Rhizoctonia solani]|uniref:DNA ligase n=1 Tax=Rhizoctonia solani TaxID=456999 RepID=A0A8H2X1K8_9AGAM|nr:unnamed protein product [Rhizoctonia solani]